MLPRLPALSSVDLTTVEASAFHYFCLYTIHQLPQKSWWQHLVLDLGRQETALAHTAIALGSMHRSLTAGSDRDVVRNQQHLAEQQYGKAMCLMRQYIERSQHGGRRPHDHEIVVLLLTSLLFFFLEAYMGRDEHAMVHLQTGLKVVYESFKTQTPPPSPANSECEDRVVATTASVRSYSDALKYTFILMDSDLNMIDEEEPCVRKRHVIESWLIFGAHRYLQSVCVDRLPLAFQNVQSAGVHLDALATRANLIWRELLTICEGYFDDHPTYYEDQDEETQGFLLGCTSRFVAIDLDGGFAQKYGDLRQDLRNWLSAWATVPQDDNNWEEHVLCQIYFFYVWYRVETWRDATEMLADRFEQQFCHITSLAEQYLDHRTSSVKYASSNTSSGAAYTTPPLFSFGTALVTTIMVIAIKCRTTSTRRRCIQIIRRINLQGFFDSAFLAAYLEAVVKLEEARAMSISGFPETKTSFEMDEVCEEARLFEPMMLPGRHFNKTGFYTANTGSMIYAEYKSRACLEGYARSALVIRKHHFSR